MKLAVKVFRFLERDTFYKRVYIVHDDGKYVGRFFAENDDEAIRLFMSDEYKGIMEK